MTKWNPYLGTSGLTQADNLLLLKTQGISFPLLSLSIKDGYSFQSCPSSIQKDYHAQIHFTGLHVALTKVFPGWPVHSWSTGTCPARSVLRGLPAIVQFSRAWEAIWSWSREVESPDWTWRSAPLWSYNNPRILSTFNGLTGEVWIQIPIFVLQLTLVECMAAVSWDQCYVLGTRQRVCEMWVLPYRSSHPREEGHTGVVTITHADYGDGKIKYARKEESRSVPIPSVHLLPCHLCSEGTSFISGQCLLGASEGRWPQWGIIQNAGNLMNGWEYWGTCQTREKKCETAVFYPWRTSP